MKKLLIITMALFVFTAFKSDKPAYTLYTADGKPVKYEKMMRLIEEADIVFFGELHNNPIAHWLQLEITQDLYQAKSGKLMLGAEMFETDNQLILNEYLEGKISESSFEKEVRLWPNYKTDYKPLVQFAKDSSLYFVATNVPRRYASVVYKQGIDTLAFFSAQARSYMAPLPIQYDSSLSCYSGMMAEMKAMGHGNENLPKSQALKDATMAYQIAVNKKDDQVFIHFNGSYHSQNKESIIWYLNQYKPGLKIVTITTVEQSEIDELDSLNMNLADFVVVVPENMTKTN